MQYRYIATALIAIGLLAACGSAKDANNSNFSKAIDTQFAQRCVAVTFDFNVNATSKTFPVSVATTQPGMFTSEKEAKERDERIFGQYDALTKVGLLTVTDIQVQPMFGKDKVPGKMYALTDAGIHALRDPKSTAFCAGHYKVDEVVNFTEPGNAMGMTISEVTFTYSPTDVPAWAKDEAITAAFPSLTKQLTPKQEGRVTMVLQNDGWRADLS